MSNNAMQPNILIICSDEHHPVISGYRNHPIIKTPHLDALAEEGTQFTRAYCNSPKCTPSRMSFLTGKYVKDIGAWAIGVPLDPGEMTWARRLKQAGIESTMLGKMHFTGAYQDGGFSHCKTRHQQRGFEPYPRNTPLPSRLDGYSRLLRRYMERAGCDDEGSIEGPVRSVIDHDQQAFDWTMEYLQEKGRDDSGEPWALYVGLLFPHWPFLCDPEYYNMYYPDNIIWPHDAKFPNPDIHPALQHYQNAQGLHEKVTDDMVRRTVAAYYGMITQMDAMIGRIIAELKAHGMYENTHIIYTSDHGESLAEHGLINKDVPYEGSVGVPLIVKGPGLPGGQTNDSIVSLVDLFPTIVDMAGLPPEPDLPGVSWLPLIHGQKHSRPDCAFSEFHANFMKCDWYMIVKDRFKYTHFDGMQPTLFDLQEDPQEMHNLAQDPTFESVVTEYHKTLLTICDTDEVSLQAKKDLGLISADGLDYTLLDLEALHELQNEGILPKGLLAEHVA